MKILHIIDTLAIGGAERMCLTAANLFASRGYKVTVLEVLAPGPLGESLNLSIKRISLNRKSKLNPATMAKLVAVLRGHDVVHIHMRHVYRYVFLANLTVGKKLILHDHFNTFPESGSTRAAFRFLLKKNIYVSVSKTGKNWATGFLKLDPEQVFLSTNVIVSNNKIERTESKKIVLVSNIKKEKFVEFIVPLAVELFRRDKNVKIDVVGKIMDEPYFNEILDRVKASGIQDNITFISNVNSVQDILNHYVLGLHFSKIESGPLVLLEYLAQDLAFVAYRTGEIAEKLNKSLPMFFMTSHDAVTWSNRIVDLVNHKIDYPALNNVFNANNDIEEYFNQWLTVYKKSLCS